MSVKFNCECGHRMKAPDGSEGRCVRCPECQAKLVIPGGNSEVMEMATNVKEALEWQEGLSRRRQEPQARWLSPAAEQWLMEHGLWVPAGIALMAVFGLLALVSYVAGFLAPIPFCIFMVMCGFGVFIYGRTSNE